MLGVDSASARPCFDGTTRGSSRISGLSRHVAVVNLALVCVRYSGKAVILIGFPFYTCIVGVNPQPWMPINTQTQECIASIRSARVAPILPNTPLKSWTEILQKSVQSWYIPFALQVHVCYDIRVSKMSSNWGYLTMRFLHANLMYRILLPVHHLNVSLYANFVHTVHELADDNLYHHKAPWWYCVPLMQLLEQRTKLQCVPPDVK